MDERAVQRLIADLKRRGYIAVVLQGPGNKERLITPNIFPAEQDGLRQNCHPDQKVTVTELSPDHDQKVTIRKKIKEKIIIVPTPDGAGNADRKRGKVFGPDSNAYKLASLLADSIAERMPTTERADERQIQSWALDFDRCRRLDKHPWAEIEALLIWSQEDTFWQGNILSGGKFRRQYLTLLAQKQRGERA